MMFAVNSFSQDDTAFQEIRSTVERIVERHEFEMVSPSCWLIYSLALRRLKAEIVSYEECFDIAKQCGITDKEELTEALHFIHTKMGLICYFPFEHIKDLVIIQPQFLYDKISKLIVKTFIFEKAGKKSADLFKERVSFRPWQIMLKFLPIFLFFYSPIFYLFFLLFNPFFFSMYPFFSNTLVEKRNFFLHMYT